MDNPSQVPIRKATSTHSNSTITSMNRSSKSSSKIFKMGIPLLVVIALVAIGYFSVKQINHNQLMSGVNSNQFQAVFLTNGQAYFGKIKDINSDFLKISDIYYLQAGQVAQPKDSSAAQSSPLSLVKLGSEIHGPEDQMTISRSQILFYENLKSNGQVVKAIQKNKGN